MLFWLVRCIVHHIFSKWPGLRRGQDHHEWCQAQDDRKSAWELRFWGKLGCQNYSYPFLLEELQWCKKKHGCVNLQYNTIIWSIFLLYHCITLILFFGLLGLWSQLIDTKGILNPQTAGISHVSGSLCQRHEGGQIECEVCVLWQPVALRKPYILEIEVTDLIIRFRRNKFIQNIYINMYSENNQSHTLSSLSYTGRKFGYIFFEKCSWISFSLFYEIIIFRQATFFLVDVVFCSDNSIFFLYTK